jgi:hypothetical protein
MLELTLDVLWVWPAARARARSHLIAGIRDVVAARSPSRGAFAAFCAARVSGGNGELSFAPTTGLRADSAPSTER